MARREQTQIPHDSPPGAAGGRLPLRRLPTRPPTETATQASCLLFPKQPTRAPPFGVCCFICPILCSSLDAYQGLGPPGLLAFASATFAVAWRHPLGLMVAVSAAGDSQGPWWQHCAHCCFYTQTSQYWGAQLRPQCDSVGPGQTTASVRGSANDRSELLLPPGSLVVFINYLYFILVRKRSDKAEFPL